MIANQEIINAINDQIANEFGAMMQYYTIGAHFAAEGLSDLSAHFYEQAEEEKKHALRIIQLLSTQAPGLTFPRYRLSGQTLRRPTLSNAPVSLADGPTVPRVSAGTTTSNSSLNQLTLALDGS